MGSWCESKICSWRLVGNADGEGRPDLIGVSAAAPILMDIFGILPSQDWFTPPYDDLIQLAPRAGNLDFAQVNIANQILPGYVKMQ